MRTQISPADAHVLQVLSHLSGDIARATELSAMYAAALDALRDGLGLERSSILLFDSHDVMRFVAWRGLSDTYRAAVEGHTPWRPDSVDAQPVCVPDVERAPDLASYRPIFAAEGIAALAFIPLLAHGRVLGRFMCYYGAPHEFGQGEIALALTIAQQVAFAVERTRTSEALRRNEKRLRYALDSAPMGTWEWDLGTNTIDWSDNLAAIHGLPAGAFDGTFAAYEREIHADDKARVFESITRAVNEGVPHDVEYRIVSPLDGTVRWVEGKGHVERGSDGKPTRMAGICMDITRRKLAELERAELASRAGFLADVSTALARSLDYATTLRAVADLAVPRIADWCSVHLKRDDGTIEDLATAHEPERLEWIRAHPELFRVHPTDRFGVALALRTNRSLLYADISDAQLPAIVNTPALRRALRTLAVRSAIVVPIRTSDDVVGAMTFLITGESGRRFTPDDLSLAEEVALRAGVAVENGRLYTAAHEANRLKDEFLATLSHELRTPLNAMLGWARMLEQGHVRAERQAHAVAIIRRNADAQARLISDILDVARITSDKLHLDPQLVDVSDTLRLTVDGIESQALASGVSLTLSAEPDLMAWADPARLQQMAWNLLSNAIKFTPAGGRVEADVRRVEDRIRVQVTDTGIGIGPEFLPHLFERFRQADASTTRAHGGLGLGLAITRHLAELQGGSVEAHSDGPGRGARFAAYLPLVRSAAPRLPAPARDARPGIPVALTGRRVLAVDDDEDARHLVCEVLSLAGAHVQPARSVAEALGALDHGAFDLVVADIAMPIEDGFTLMDRLATAARGNGRPLVPVIAVTAYAREEDRARALAAGFAAHVAKPIDASSLIDTAAMLLARKGA